ncbi:ATP-binding cassette domain-containing protein [Corynebacterium pseudopelargi]|nr:ATP-binding cassette domain-containing protein [Corynebacterium pseudopelargi]
MQEQQGQHSRRYIWGASGSGLSQYAWEMAEHTGAAWVGNDAAAHISLLRATVEQELAFGMEQLAVPRDEMFARIAKAAEQWGLTPLLQRDPASLSTGQTRRVAIASALLVQPSGLVLDCPLDGCDTAAQATLAQVINGFDGEVSICDRRWTVLADDAESFEYREGVLHPMQPPRPQLQQGSYLPLEQGVEAAAQDNDVVLNEVIVHRGERKAGRGGGRSGWRGAGSKPGRGAGPKAERGAAPTFALGPVSLRFPAGAITHLRGANGCGKTTLMLAAAGLIPHQGQVQAPTIGWVPTAMDQAFSQPSALREVSLGSDQAHAEAALAWCGLEEVAQLHPLDLPSSQRRLLAFACAIVRGPGAIFLDEPTVGLDTAGIEQLAVLMQRFVQGKWHEHLRERGLAALHEGLPSVVWSCHEQDFAHISDFVVDLPLS